tara:strand:+ start:243 stop:1301 length:1059 start_codon:yes stop_codon:yes gene_type:complete
MGKLRKLGKKIGNSFKKIGKKLKNGLKKVASKFAELGPLGTIALSFVIPTVGAWFQGLPNGSFLKTIADGVSTFAGKIKNGVGKVFNTVMDGVENGLNGISGKALNERGWGSAFRDGVSNMTGDFIEGSTKGLDLPAKESLFKTGDAFDAAKKSGEIDFKQAQASYDRKLDSRISKLNRKAEKGKLGEEAYNKAMSELLESRPTDQSAFKIEPTKPFTERDTFKQKQDLIGERSIFGKASPATPDTFAGKKAENLNLRDYIKTSKEFGVAKTLMPVQAATSVYFKNEEAQEAALEYAKTAQRKYFADVGADVLIKPVNRNVSYMDFSSNLNGTDLFKLQNAYTGILGEDLYG